MAEIKVGIVRRTNPGGGKKLYALGLHYTNISEAELLNYMQQNSQLGKGLAVAAVEAFKAAFTTFLVKTPAQVHASSEATTARSFFTGFGRIPQMTPDA